MKRRELLLKSAGLGLLGLTSCTRMPDRIKKNSSESHVYHPVKSSMDRVLQSVVGLRPFRPQGYRLETEYMAEKTIVHNYGHGGAGITLSWGTSEIAAKQAAAANNHQIAILGAGVMGLTTALILARKGYDVRMYAENFPPYTTSNIAAALWLPTSYYDRNAVTQDFARLDTSIIRNAFKRFLNYTNRPEYGVYWNNYHLLLPSVPKTNRVQPGGNDLYPELTLSTTQTLFNFPYQKRMKALMIDPNYYLEKLFSDAQIAGVQSNLKQFSHLKQILSLPEKTIVNCTGLGAKKLFGDDTMIPVQGQLTHLLPQKEINYSYVTPTPEGYLYMFPRKGSIVLGGTSVRGAYSTQPDMALTQRMVKGHAELAKRL